ERAQSPARRQRPSLHRFECAYPNLVNGRSLLYPSGAEKRAALPRALPVYWLPTPRITSRQTYPQGPREYRSSEIPAETAQIPGLESVQVFFWRFSNCSRGSHCTGDPLGTIAREYSGHRHFRATARKFQAFPVAGRVGTAGRRSAKKIIGSEIQFVILALLSRGRHPVNDRLRALSARGMTVKDDWRAWLPGKKDEV